jgi:hypothetical protein
LCASAAPRPNAWGLAHPSEALNKTDADTFTSEHAERALADEQEIIRSGEGILEKEEMQTWPGRARDVDDHQQDAAV